MVIAAGCGDSTAPVTAADVVGTYALVSIAGQALPVPFGGTSMLAREVTTFQASGSWTDSAFFQDTAGGAISLVQQYTGTWSVDGSALHETYRATGGTPVSSTYQIKDHGQTLTFAGYQGEWVYRKQ